MKQLEFAFMNSYKAKAEKLLRKMGEYNKSHLFTLDELEKLVEKYHVKYKSDIKCDTDGYLYSVRKV